MCRPSGDRRFGIVSRANALVSRCGDDLSCPAGQTCDIISNECGSASEALILRDDTAADFRMGAYTAEVAIESQGFVGPIPYLTGGVQLSGYDGLLLGDLGAASFEATAVRELGDAVAFERIAWTTRQAAEPSAVIVKLRTCDTAEACAGEPYVEVENATAPNVVPRRFTQYAVEMTSNGDVPTALDAIELRYFVRGTE
jgi:hypothetical protein